MLSDILKRQTLAKQQIDTAIMDLRLGVAALSDLAITLESLVKETYPGGPLTVWVCDKCGQPLPQGQMCNSSMHVGPGEGPNGNPISTVNLVLGES